MFREVARKKQALTKEACIEIIKSQKRGVLSVIGDDGYPYGLPINHYYCDEDGKLYFHSGTKGHKIDAINKCDKMSFCVYDEALSLCRQLCYHFTDDEQYIENEIQKDGARVLVFALVPEHITGKLVNES